MIDFFLLNRPILIFIWKNKSTRRAKSTYKKKRKPNVPEIGIAQSHSRQNQNGILTEMDGLTDCKTRLYAEALFFGGRALEAIQSLSKDKHM